MHVAAGLCYIMFGRVSRIVAAASGQHHTHWCATPFLVVGAARWLEQLSLIIVILNLANEWLRGNCLPLRLLLDLLALSIASHYSSSTLPAIVNAASDRLDLLWSAAGLLDDCFHFGISGKIMEGSIEPKDKKVIFIPKKIWPFHNFRRKYIIYQKEIYYRSEGYIHV